MDKFVQITRQGRIEEKDFYDIINAASEELWQTFLPAQIPTEGLSSTVEKNIITPPNSPIPECQTCGACCAPFLCVGVRPNDKVDPDNYWDIIVKGTHGEIVVDRYLRRDPDSMVCTALEGELGASVACRIYADRPISCRDFEAGSDRCHAIRRAYGIEPFMSLEEMSAAVANINNQPEESTAADRIKHAQISEMPETELLLITAQLKDGELREIHRFDPMSEAWMQFEFEGLTLIEAERLINSRSSLG